MRRSSGGFSGPGQKDAVTWLLIAIVGMFLLQSIIGIWFGSNIIEVLFALSTAHLKTGFVWTILSYGFLHADFFHILVNGLGIFFIGRPLEAEFGSKRVMMIFFTAVLLGGVVWLAISGGGMSLLLGASAGVFGLLTFFCLAHPEQPITLLLFFVIPVTLKPKVILWGLLAIEGFLLLFYEIPGRTVVASSAHLGGVLGGFILYQLMNNPHWMPKLRKPAQKVTQPKRGKVIHKATTKNFKVNIENKAELKAEVDRILDKINNDGFGALTKEERATLDKAKKVLDR